MLQPKHTSHQISPRFTGRPPNRTSSPTTLAPANSYSMSRSSERSPETMAPSTRPSTFTVPRSMESPIDQTIDFQAGNLSEFLPPNKPWWWSKDTCLAKESAGRYSHHRESSLTSTLGSTGPNSPCSPNISTPQIAAADSVDDSCDGHSSSPWNYHFTTSDPIPLQQDHYLYTGPQLLGLQMSNPNTKVPYTMNSYMGNQSYRPPKASDVQIQHQSQPRTPKGFATRQLGHYASDGDPENRRRVIPDVPKLDRTMTDVYNDGLYNPNLDIVASSSGNPERQPPTANNVFSHLNTGTSTLASSSPGCHHGSDTPPNHSHFHPPQGAYNVGTLRQNAAPRSVSEVNSPQTISPQDSLLDFAEGDCTKNFTLFPRAESSRFGGMNQLTDEEVSLGQCESSTPQYLVDDEAIGSAHYLSPGTSGVYALHNLSAFGAQQHLQPTITFEGRGNASNASRTSGGRPGESEDGGTYSCTYHGCMLRFDTPALLQKHKREGHRQAGGLKPTQRGMKGAVMDTQAGPHRCYRINPGTGKICRAVFSRPYDLTRHEDTIHNARKQKVRCDLCTEEKLFSRADALTRHYRVCHPDVELPGKHRRRRNMN